MCVCPQKKYEQLLQEQKDLAACRDDLRDLTVQFKQRTKKLTQSMKEEKSLHED